MGPLSFEQRRATVDAGMRSGEIGCGFGGYAARAGKVVYCPTPSLTDMNSLQAYGRALSDFCLGEDTVLIALADEDPPTYEQGYMHSHELYAATLHGTCMANRSMIHKLLQFNMPLEAVEQLDHMDREQRMRMAHGPAWLRQPQNRAMLDNMFMVEGPAALALLHAQTASMRKLIAFVMAPYYEPINGKPHPRYSPHYALALNYVSDVTDAHEKQPRNVEAVQAWTKSVVGYPYKQGFHIPQIPVPRDVPKEAWKPKD